MAAAKKSAPRETSNLPINYQEQLAKESQEITKRLQSGGGSKIRAKGNTSFAMPDGTESPVIEGVVVEFTAMNTFYDRPYDKDTPSPPACYAIGDIPSLLAPSKDVPDRQADNCATCPMNQFGTADNGKGKACKNKRILAILPEDADDSTDIMLLEVPPSSIGFYDSYVASLSSKHKTVPVGVITRITLDPKQQYFSPRFEVVRPLQGNEFGAFVTRRDEAKAMIATPPDTSTYEAPKKAAAGRRR